MKKKSPAFQFYPSDWLNDIDVMLMTAEQEGAYLRLILICWMDNDLSIPDDDEQLIVLSRINKGGLTKVKAKFKQHPTKTGFLTHSRLEREAKKQQIWREKSSLGGKKSSRKGTENKEENKGGLTKVKAKPDSSSSSPSPKKKNPLPPFQNPQPEKTEKTASRGVLKNGIREGVGKKNGAGNYRIENFLSDDAWQDARSHAPGLDIHNLCAVYNEKINSGEREKPLYPNAAFPKWCKNYYLATLGKSGKTH